MLLNNIKNMALRIFTYVFYAIISSTFCMIAFGFNIPENEDSTKNESSIWTMQVGYFPDYTNSFTSDGVSFLLLNESIVQKEISHGYFLSLQRSFNNKQNTNNPNGSFSIGAFLNYPFYINNNSLIIRGGIGFGYPTAAVNVLNIIMIEYTTPLNNNIAFSFSIAQQIVRLNYFLPVQLNAGVRF